MSGANTFKFVMLPPQSNITRGWGRQLADAMPEVRVVIAEDQATAEREIVDAEAAFGRLSREVLAKARRLRWLQAPQIAPPAGYYYPELIEHSLTVTNFREIFNDHISAHIMAFVLAFARGLQIYIPQQLRREWKKPADNSDVVHLPEATALIVGVGGIGAETARLAAAFGMTVLATDARRAEAPPGVAELHKPEALDALLPRADFVILTVPHTPATEGFMQPRAFPAHEAQRVLHQHRPRHDDETGRSGGGAERRRDRRRRTRCIRAGAAAGRPSAMDNAERAADAAHGRARAVSR